MQKVRLILKQVNLSTDKKDIFITISIDEGGLFKFGKTTIYGIEDFDSQIIKNI